MENIIKNLKRHWRTYGVTLWMIGVTGFLIYMNTEVRALGQTDEKLVSDVDTIESVLISTDSNVNLMKKTVDDMSAKVTTVHKRVKRR